APGRSQSRGRRGAGRIATARLGRRPMGSGADPSSSTGLEPSPGGLGDSPAGMSGLSPQRERELSGRWSRVSAFLDDDPLDVTVRAVAMAQLMLDRYGV